MRVSVLVVLLAATVLVRSVAACDEEYKTCYAGDLLGCTCDSGAPGYAQCSPLGDFATAACVCDGTTPGIDAGPADAAATCSAAEPCPNDADVCTPRGVCRPGP